MGANYQPKQNSHLLNPFQNGEKSLENGFRTSFLLQAKELKCQINYAEVMLILKQTLKETFSGQKLYIKSPQNLELTTLSFLTMSTNV